MSDRDIDELFRRFAELDRELKELKVEVGEMKRPKGLQLPPVFNSDGTQDHSFYSRVWENDKPAQWPNEPYTDYLKRIGEYNEAMIYEDDTK